MQALWTDRPIHDDILAVGIVISRSLLDDVAFDSAAYTARQCELSAMARMDDDGTRYAYRYLTPDAYGYEPGPFAYRRIPGDLPDDAALVIGRVQVTKKVST